MINKLPVRQHLGGHHHDHSHEHSRGGAAHGEYAPPLVELARGGLTESVHRGAVVVSGPGGGRIRGIGHPAMPTFLRSSAKPLQALPVVQSGAAERFDLSDKELAIMCASHNGEEIHVNTVLGVLEKLGLGQDALLCGSHYPFEKDARKEMLEKGMEPQSVHCNCSGKHSSMLALCVHLGLPLEDYTNPQHPVQVMIKESIARMCAYPAEQIGVGVDGCGAPVFRLPLTALAGAYARLAAPEEGGLESSWVEAVKAIRKAHMGNPYLVAGKGRVCTALMQAKPGLILAKSGAEGVYAAALMDRGQGVAVQIEDGNSRAVPTAIVETLHQLGVLDHDDLEGALAEFHMPMVKNHHKNEVAQLRPVFHLD